MPRQPKTHFLSNATLLREIEKSKRTYCTFLRLEYADYDQHIQAIEEATEPGRVYRLNSFDHVPQALTKKSRSRVTGADGQERTNFTPFIHLLGDCDGPVLVGRSHWRGSLADGEFSQDHGRITNRLALSLRLFVERFGMKPNFRGYSYREDMEAASLLQLFQAALKFDASKSNNPFAFYTTTVNNVFLRYLKDEKRQRDIRDDILQDAGMTPSHTRQIEHDLRDN